MTDQRWERVEVREIRRGDKVAKTREQKPREVIDIGPIGQSSRWLHFPDGRIRPKHETKLWRLTEEAQAQLEERPLESAPSPAPASAAVKPPPGHPGFSPEVQDALHSAGMSRNSELTPEQLERAEKLASGGIRINHEDPRRAFILRGERSTMATSDGKRTRNSETQKGLEAAVKVLKASRKPLTRKEIHEKAVKLGVDLGQKASGSPKIGGVVNEAKAAGTEVDGYRFTNPERGKYSVEKVKASKAAPKKASASKASSSKKASSGKASGKAAAGKGAAKK